MALTLLLACSTDAQDQKAYSTEEVPLSHKLEASTSVEAWKEIKKASDHFPASSHSETSGSLPPGEPGTKYIKSWLVATADKAQEFYTKFPSDTNAAAAKEIELNVLWQALDETYATNLFPRILGRATDILSDTRIDRTKRFTICQSIFIIALAKQQLFPSSIDVPAALEKAARIAEKDFQGLGQVQLLTWVAEDAKAGKNRPLFRQFSDDLKKMAAFPDTQGFVFRMLVQVLSLQRKAIGQPLDLEFNATDGHTVKLSEFKGKPVAISFWGVSYPESITNVLRITKLHEKLHANGFEAIGVNVDHDSETLTKFISENKIAWPQYWDGKEMENKVVAATRVIRAGTILLIDKSGKIRDINGDEGLENKIKTLVAEK